MNPLETLIPIVVMLGAFALAWGLYYLKNRENMAMIERGMNPRHGRQQPRPFINLKYGLLLLGAGLGLLAAYVLDCVIAAPVKVTPNGTTYQSDNPALYFALVAIGGGLGLFISYRIEKREWLDKQQDRVDTE